MSEPTPNRRKMDTLNPHDENGNCVALKKVVERIDQSDSRFTVLESKIDINNTATAEILDILNLAKSFFRILGIVGSLAKWVAAIAAPIVGFWLVLKNGGKP